MSGAEEGQAQGTLDLECADDGMYAMLYQVTCLRIFHRVRGGGGEGVYVCVCV